MTRSATQGPSSEDYSRTNTGRGPAVLCHDSHGSPSGDRSERISHAFLATRDGRFCNRRPAAAPARRARLRPDLRMSAGRPRAQGLSSSPTSRPRPCPTTINRRCRRRAITGRPATGPGTTMTITGCPASGSSRPSPNSCGRPATGPSSTASIASTGATGVRVSASTAGSTTDTDTGSRIRRRPLGQWPLFLQSFGQQFRRCCASPTSTIGRFRPPVVVNMASFNGGGGTVAKPTPERNCTRQTERRVPPTPLQRSQVRAASMTPEQFLTTNQGKPGIAATPRPGEFKGKGVVPAKAAGSAQTAPATAPSGQPRHGRAEASGRARSRSRRNRSTRRRRSRSCRRPRRSRLRRASRRTAPTKLQEKLPAGEKPIKVEPLNVPAAPQKLPEAPAQPVAPGQTPNGATKLQEKLPAAEKPTRVEPLSVPKAATPPTVAKPPAPIKPELTPESRARGFAAPAGATARAGVAAATGAAATAGSAKANATSTGAATATAVATPAGAAAPAATAAEGATTTAAAAATAAGTAAGDPEACRAPAGRQARDLRKARPAAVPKVKS